MKQNHKRKGNNLCYTSLWVIGWASYKWQVLLLHLLCRSATVNSPAKSLMYNASVVCVNYKNEKRIRNYLKPRLFYFVLLLYSTTLFGQPKQINPRSRFDSTNRISADRQKTIDRIANKDKNTDSFIENNLPWIVALSICIFSFFLNLKMTKDLQLSNERKIQLQIESNERNLQYQIDKSLELYLQNLKLIVASNNKQEWLNDVRMCIANFLTNITFIKPEVKALYKSEDFITYVEKVLLYKSKAEILLTEQNYDEKEVLNAINDFSEILNINQSEYNDNIFQEKRKNLLLATRNFYKNHQRKIRYN
jgi:hypothetical protein